MHSQKNEYEEQQDEEDFRCPECKWYFSSITKPYILPCNHHICLKCIDLLITENKTICPICNTFFNKKERDTFQINIVFLNIFIKILQSKVILCKNCNKIFYWKEHYNTCDQSYFTETTQMFNNIKLACEEGIRIIKLFNNQKNVLIKYKKNIFDNLKKSLIEISNCYKKEINTGFKKLFSTKKKINFLQYKKEIITFLELCLPYNNYFNQDEIINILEKYNPSLSPQKIVSTFNNFGLSPIRPDISPHSPFNLKSVNPFLGKKSSTMMITQMSKGNQNNINNIKTSTNINNIRTEQNFNMMNKMMNDKNCNRNIFNSMKYINVNANANDNANENINDNNNISKYRKNFYLKKHNSKTAFYCSNTRPKNKKNKFNIYEILNENEPNEENDKKRIIVGLKDVRVISNTNKFKKDNNNISNDKSKNIIHIQKRNINNKIQNNNNNINNINNIHYSHINNLNIKNEINNYNMVNNESQASTIRVENPSLSLLRSTEYTKRIFPLNAEDKRKRLIRHQKACENSEKEKKIIRNMIFNGKSDDKNRIINSSSCLLINNNINNRKSLTSMNRLVKHFNKIKDIVNEINNFNEFLTFTSDYIKKDVDIRILFLSKIILNDYNLLLNEITYNISHTSRRNIINFLENSKKISIFNTNINKFKTKDFSNILTQTKEFNKSMSIDFDDIDLIFITGGYEDIEDTLCSNLFVILKWSTETIHYTGTLPERKAYHSSLYHDNNLYIIGGIDSNKKVSKNCRHFCLKEKKWYNLPCLNAGRANASLCIYNNKTLYVFRGRDDNNVLDSIEYINLFNMRSCWKLFKPIDYGYVWNAAQNSLVLIIDKEKIVICGGEDNDGNLLNDTFLFETNTKNIYKGIDMIFPASFKNYGGYNQGKFFCVDFKNENNNINNKGFGNVHMFDPKENIWTFN